MGEICDEVDERYDARQREAAKILEERHAKAAQIRGFVKVPKSLRSLFQEYLVFGKFMDPSIVRDLREFLREP